MTPLKRKKNPFSGRVLQRSPDS